MKAPVLVCISNRECKLDYVFDVQYRTALQANIYWSGHLLINIHESIKIALLHPPTIAVRIMTNCSTSVVPYSQLSKIVHAIACTTQLGNCATPTTLLKNWYGQKHTSHTVCAGLAVLVV